MNVSLIYRKRVITQDDLCFIKKVIDDYRSEGHSAISRRLCEVWDWRQANGQLKDGVCRGLLLQLERNQLVTLPPRILDNHNNALRRRKTQATFDFHPTPLNATLADLAPIELRLYRSRKNTGTTILRVSTTRVLGVDGRLSQALKKRPSSNSVKAWGT